MIFLSLPSLACAVTLILFPFPAFLVTKTPFELIFAYFLLLTDHFTVLLVASEFIVILIFVLLPAFIVFGAFNVIFFLLKFYLFLILLTI